MEFDRTKEISSPHSEGLARITFSPNGLYMYTAGADGYIRVYDANLTANPPFESKLIEYHDDEVLALSASNAGVCTAAEGGTVILHSHAPGTQQNEVLEVVTRCSFPVRSVRFDPKGKRIAVASEELIVKIVDAADPLKIQLLAGHKRSVRAASWSPDGNLIATSSSDGQIMIWELNAGSEATCIHTIDGLIKADQPSSMYTVEAVWHPSGKYFVVPSRTNEIVVVSRDTWGRAGTFSASSGHSGEISSLAFSPNGQYLASTGQDRQLLIWNTATKEIIHRTTHNADQEGLITDMAFHPSPDANLLAYVDTFGKLVKWHEPVPANLPGPGVQSSRARGQSIAPSNGGLGEGDEDDYGFDDFIEDDTGLGEYAERPSKLPPRLNGQSTTTSYGYGAKTRGQEAFQPGSTPMRGGRRYLAFNMLGLIQAVEKDDLNLVTIEFHDRSAHTGEHFSDTFKFSLGALGELGSAYGCKSSGDSPSVVHYRPYDSWANIQKWDYKLPEGEEVVALALGGVATPDEAEVGIAGSGTVLVATSAGYVRFLSGAGLQKYLWNLGEEVISMAAARDWALVVYRVGAAADGRQNLAYALIDTDTYEVVQQGNIPLVKDATLTWIGFTDEHIPAMYDSNGVFSLLDRARRPRQARWVPALDTRLLTRREGKQESYWPVGVSEQHAHVIILKGNDQHPGFPTPLFQELDLQFPLLQLELEQAQLEEKYLRESFFAAYRRDGAPPDDYALKSKLGRAELETDKHLIKLIQTFCKAERLEAALDAALLLSQAASLVAAGKLAGYYKMPGLEERVQVVKEHKEAEQEGTKREGKWAHLVDERTITTEPVGGGAKRGSGAAGWFNAGSQARREQSSAPPSSSFVSRLPPSSMVSSYPRAGTRQPEYEGEGDDMEVVEEDIEQAQEETYEESEHVEQLREDRRRMKEETRRLQEELEASAEEEADTQEEPERETVMAPPPIRKAINPFAKKSAASKPAPPAVNPFASKSASKTRDLGAKGSFFGRVEGSEPAKAKPKPKASSVAPSSSAKTPASSGVTSASKDGTLQTFLFNKAPSAATAKPKKRKSDAVEDAAGVSDAATPGKRKEAREARELPREGDEFEETQETPTEGESQSEGGSRASLARTATEVIVEASEGEDAEMEDTQEATQGEDDEVAAAVGLEAKAASGAGLSKLERFRNAAA